MGEPLYKAESFKIVGLCMEVHNHLGRGFSEIVYKDALEIESSPGGSSFEISKAIRVN